MPSIPNTFTSNTVIKSSEANANFSALANSIRPTFVFPIVGTVTVGTDLAPSLVVPTNLSIVKAYLVVKTAPVGQEIIVDINVNGTSIWNATQANRVEIAASATSGNQTSFDITSLSEGDIITVDVDQVGTTTPGTDLTIQLKCE